jgi:hypothetical protein
MIRPIVQAHCDTLGCKRFVVVSMCDGPVHRSSVVAPGHGIEFPICADPDWVEGSWGTVWCPDHSKGR